jgi:YVTN family beta-propeller protein
VVRHGRVGAPAIDFDADGDATETLPMDVNDGPQCESASADQTLHPFDDWEHLGAELVPGDDAGADPPTEPTYEHHQQLQAFWDQALVPDATTVVEPPQPGLDRTVLGLAADDRFVYATHQYRTASNPSQPIGDGKLVLLDRRTMAVVARITVGHAPRAVAINPLTNRAYVVNGGKDSYSLSVVDLGARKEIAEIALGQNPIDVAVNTKLNRVYVSNPFQKSIHVIDGKTNAKLAPIPIGQGALGLAVDEARGAIYVAMTNRIPGTPLVIALGVAVDDGVGRPQVLPRVELGEEAVQPQDVAYDPASDRLYVGGLGGVGTLPPSVTVLDGQDRQIIKRIAMPGPVRAVGVNPASGLVVAAGDRGVELIDEQTLQSVRHIDAGLAFAAAAPTGHARQLFTGDFRSGEVRRLSYSSGEPR